MSISFDVANGAIMEGDIRYVMMRPDVLMGIALELGEREAEAFLAAMERSAFRNSQTSFARHLESGRLKLGSLLARVGDVAALLGWGVWTAEIVRTA